MCTTCGCGTDAATVTNLQTAESAVAHAHDHVHGGHSPPHRHDGAGHAGGSIALEARILAKNDARAGKNRAWFAGREILALNLVSAPGAGKTALLERMIVALKPDTSIAVIEGDQATLNDAARIRKAGAPAVQVNTGTGCHLDADMVARAVAQLAPAAGSLLLIENVGNLVCPALFDLGEKAKIVIFSVTEGEDKPLKYPHMFQAAGAVVLSKTDLLPHLDFALDEARANIRRVNPNAVIFEASARTGAGLGALYRWLRAELRNARESAFA